MFVIITNIYFFSNFSRNMISKWTDEKLQKQKLHLERSVSLVKNRQKYVVEAEEQIRLTSPDLFHAYEILCRHEFATKDVFFLNRAVNLKRGFFSDGVHKSIKRHAQVCEEIQAREEQSKRQRVDNDENDDDDVVVSK